MFRTTHVQLSVLAGVLLCAAAAPVSGQNIVAFAGNGSMSSFGDGGQATFAGLNLMKGLAMDRTGNLYIADTENFRIRKVNASGIISTVAGNGQNGYSGDGGLATNASLSDVSGVAVDAAGNIYIADSSNRRLRKVNPQGIISTIAGTGTQGYTGDGGQAVNATLGRPLAVNVDAYGNVYYVDSVNAVVRKISTDGTIHTVVGNGVTGYTGNGGQASSAELAFPLGMTMDLAGNMYIADANNNVIRKVSPTGIISTFAGNGMGRFAGDGGLATAASLNIPSDVALDGQGNLYIADSGNNRVRKVNSSGIISTVAGGSTNGFSGNGGPAANAILNYPWGLTTDEAGNVYIADRVNNMVRMIQSGASLGPVTLRANSPVVNGASFIQGMAIAPGSAVTIFGSNLAAVPAAALQTPLPTVMGDTSVTFNGIQAPIYYISGGQINVQAPFNLLPGTATVQVQRGNQMSAPVQVSVAAFSPAIFVLDSNNSGAFLNAANYRIVTSAAPVAAGASVALYGTGLGTVNQNLASGAGAPSNPPAQANTWPTVTVGGKNATVSFAGLAPGFVGLYQVNFVVPAGVGTGPQPVQMSEGGVTSNTATLYVGP